MYLHEVQDGQTLKEEYGVFGTSYKVVTSPGGVWQVWRRDVGGYCRAESAELVRRFSGRAVSAKFALDVCAWLQDVWAKRVALALTLGEGP